MNIKGLPDFRHECSVANISRLLKTVREQLENQRMLALRSPPELDLVGNVWISSFRLLCPRNLPAGVDF